MSYPFYLFKYEHKSKADGDSDENAKTHNLGSPNILIPGIFFNF